MRRASMWLNLYGRQVVQHKLKKGAKNAFMPTNMSTTVFRKQDQFPTVIGLKT